jgi:SNF2 family DNA or RNA helicase
MGLGKTIMSVALIATHMRKPFPESDEKINNPKKLIKAGTLIIVPTSILGQW